MRFQKCKNAKREIDHVDYVLELRFSDYQRAVERKKYFGLNNQEAQVILIDELEVDKNLTVDGDSSLTTDSKPKFGDGDEGRSGWGQRT